MAKRNKKNSKKNCIAEIVVPTKTWVLTASSVCKLYKPRDLCKPITGANQIRCETHMQGVNQNHCETREKNVNHADCRTGAKVQTVKNVFDCIA